MAIQWLTPRLILDEPFGLSSNVRYGDSEVVGTSHFIADAILATIHASICPRSIPASVIGPPVERIFAPIIEHP